MKQPASHPWQQATTPQGKRLVLIKQDELEAILTARAVVETLKRDLKLAAEELDRRELVLIARVEAGTPCAPGDLHAAINVQAGRRVPKWKEVYAALAGPEAVERVINETVPSADTKKLVISRSGRVEKSA